MCYLFYGFPAHCPRLFVSSALGANMQSLNSYSEAICINFFTNRFKKKVYYTTSFSRCGVSEVLRMNILPLKPNEYLSKL